MSRAFAADRDDVYQMVNKYYGKVLSSSEDLKTTACCTMARPPPIIRNALANVPDEIKSKYYGCGIVAPYGMEGLDVLDLGSGSGQDCYIASQLVGEHGSVTGIDMTDEQLDVAQQHVDSFCQKLGYAKPNLRFVKGYIELLDKAGIESESMDLVISNCVVNLSPNKESVLSEVYRVLKTGGEFYFSDVYCDRRLPESVVSHEVLFGECLGGALYTEDFRRICQRVGFQDPRILTQSPIEVTDDKLAPLLGNAKFYSITYRLFKTPLIEDRCEDFGQVATYLGSIPGHEHNYPLDDHHLFITGKPMLVCGNTASMVGDTWLSKHFRVDGDQSVHYGLFDCAPASTGSGAADGASSAGGSCC